MLKIKIATCILLGSVAYYGCTSESSKESSVQLKNRIDTISVSSNKYIVKVYNDQGKLKDSLIYIDDKLNGIMSLYNYDKSTVQHPIYVNNIRVGHEKGFYLNGELFYEGEFRASKRVNEWRFYHENGELATYEYYHPNGELAYIRTYDSTGKLESKNGEGFITFSKEPRKDTLHFGEVLEFNVYVANPPNTKTEVGFGEDLPNIDSIKMEIHTLNKGWMYGKHLFSRKGLSELVISWSINDTIENETEHGVKRFSFYIK